MIKKTLSVVTLLAAGASHAAGFAFDTQSGRATGMSFATASSTNDSTSIAFNPANILGVQKLDISLGDVTTLPQLTLAPATGQPDQSMDTTVVPLPHVFGVYRLNEQMAAGIGVFVPFAAGANWKDDFLYRTRGYKAQIATYFINPTFAYQPHERLRFGVGLDIVRGTVSLTRKINFVTSEGQAKIGGAGWGLGYNAGVNVEILEKLLSFGAAFRGPTKVKFDGKADFQDVPAGFQSMLSDQDVEAEVTLPGSVDMGFGFTPIDRLTIAADAHMTLWSSLQEFGIAFPNNPALTSLLPKHWDDVWSFHLGAEYGLTETISLRIGGQYDLSGSPSDTLTPDLPDFDRIAGSVGLGFNFSPFRADLGYQYTRLLKTESTALGFAGDYSGQANTIGLTLGYTMK
jgi:long-chain fatty acid transport protein